MCHKALLVIYSKTSVFIWYLFCVSIITFNSDLWVPFRNVELCYILLFLKLKKKKKKKKLCLSIHDRAFPLSFISGKPTWKILVWLVVFWNKRNVPTSLPFHNDSSGSAVLCLKYLRLRMDSKIHCKGLAFQGYLSKLLACGVAGDQSHYAGFAFTAQMLGAHAASSASRCPSALWPYLPSSRIPSLGHRVLYRACHLRPVHL